MQPWPISISTCRSTTGTPARRLLKPMVLAKLIQAAEIGPQDRVLDVACGTGYSTALLARLARSRRGAGGGRGARRACAREPRRGRCANVEVVTGALPDGWPAGAPYDVILVNGAAEVVPERLLRQLAEGGRLVVVVGPGAGQQGRALSRRRRAGERIADLRCRRAALPGFAAPPAFVF